MKPISVKSMQNIDLLSIKRYKIPSMLLMENAGRKVAEETVKFKPKSVAVICGAGNNGGDGLVASRHLFNSGVLVTIYTLKSFNNSTPETKTNYKIASKMRIPMTRYKSNAPLERYDLVIDAILGTGTKGKLRDNIAKIIENTVKKSKKILAIDVPSGLDADTGKSLGPVIRAKTTVTMGLPKKGLITRSARPYVGKLVVADIGIPLPLIKKYL